MIYKVFGISNKQVIFAANYSQAVGIARGYNHWYCLPNKPLNYFVMNYVAVFESIAKSNGASYNLHNHVLNPDSGFMVAIANFEKTYPVPNHKDDLQDYVIDYIFSNKHAWNMIKENPDSLYVGFWIYDGRLYIDLAENIADFGTALHLAIERHQIAFYDCASKMDVKVNVHHDASILYNEHPALTIQD